MLLLLLLASCSAVTLLLLLFHAKHTLCVATVCVVLRVGPCDGCCSVRFLLGNIGACLWVFLTFRPFRFVLVFVLLAFVLFVDCDVMHVMVAADARRARW